MSRRIILSVYKLRKQLKESDEPVWCEYCGLPADTVDHVKPVAYTNAIEHLAKISNTKLVYCCRECNSIAGSRVFQSLAAKRAYIQQRLRQKYKKYLKMPNWSEDELSEMGSEMRRYIEQGQAMKGIVARRVRWPRE